MIISIISIIILSLSIIILSLTYFQRIKSHKEKYNKLCNDFNEKIAEIKQKNQELQIQTANAEISSKEKALFLSAMSHEIRTPLNSIIGMAHLLMQENPRADQLENLKILKFSAEGLLSLINNILDLSKIDAGRIDIENIDFNIKELAQGITSAQNQRAKEKNIELNLFIDQQIPEVIKGDPTRLSQILNNLVANAVKFTKNGSVNVDIVLEKYVDNYYYIKFTILDTGIGIPQDKLSSIFENFSQASPQITRTFGGTGLGLAITKKLLNLQNADISVQSEVDKGSKFYFTLRFEKSTTIKPVKSHNYEMQTTNYPSLQGVKILLVEDNEANRIIASKFLHKWDVQIDMAVNGKEAVEKVLANKYALVLMDLQMPIKDGYQATDEIRKHNNGEYAELPIIALTASALLDVNDRIILTGMNDYITKPFIPSELYNKIKKWSESGKTIIA